MRQDVFSAGELEDSHALTHGRTSVRLPAPSVWPRL